MPADDLLANLPADVIVKLVKLLEHWRDHPHAGPPDHLLQTYNDFADLLWAPERPLLRHGDEPDMWPALSRYGLVALYQYDRTPPAAQATAERQLVTLRQLTTMVGKSKSWGNNLKDRKKNPLPPPDVEGGGGKAGMWDWSRIRPWLQAEVGRQLPEHFPERPPGL
jgi:hypothetical protein